MKFKKTISILLALVMLALPLVPVNTSASTLFQTDSYRDQVMETMLVYATYVHRNGKYFYTNQKQGACYSAVTAKNSIKRGKKVNINCVSVINWALKAQGLGPANGHFYTSDGKLVNYSGNLKRFSTVVTKNIAGKSFYNAVRSGAVKPGDICALTGGKAGSHHTVVFLGYSKWSKGESLTVVDSGSASGKKCKGNGVCIEYLSNAKTQKIHRVVRLSNASKNW